MPDILSYLIIYRSKSSSFNLSNLLFDAFYKFITYLLVLLFIKDCFIPYFISLFFGLFPFWILKVSFNWGFYTPYFGLRGNLLVLIAKLISVYLGLFDVELFLIDDFPVWSIDCKYLVMFYGPWMECIVKLVLSLIWLNAI